MLTALTQAQPATGTRDPAQDAAGASTVVIRRGGTYSGNWDSTNAETPAVTVETTEPVHLRHCRVSGPGHLIRSVMPGSDITVSDCVGFGRTPWKAGLPHGRFVAVFRPSRLVVTNNELVSTAGIYVDGGGHGANRVAILRNRARNIEGRHSTGTGALGTGAALMQFVQLNNLRHSPDVEIAWNEVVNEPGASRVEDIISIHRSSGTAAQPIRITHNFLMGAYPARPEQDGFSGGGIIVDGSTLGTETTGHILISGNQVLETTNYGIAVSAGVGVRIHGNRVIGTGLLPDGRSLPAANVGLYVWDFYGDKAKGLPFRDHRVSGNQVAWWNRKGQRNDAWFPDCADRACEGNESLNLARDRRFIEDEQRTWRQKLSDSGTRLGPR